VGTISPIVLSTICFIKDLSHSLNGHIGRNALTQVETIIGWFESASAGSFPFMGIAETLAHGPAYFGSLTGAHPDDRVYARNIRKLELIYTGFCVLGFLGGGL